MGVSSRRAMPCHTTRLVLVGVGWVGGCHGGGREKEKERDWCIEREIDWHPDSEESELTRERKLRTRERKNWFLFCLIFIHTLQSNLRILKLKNMFILIY